MRRGYVRLWRCSEDSAVWQDDGLWRLWCHLIIQARYKDGWVSVDRVAGPVELKRGQLIVGRFTLHRALYPKKRKSHPSPITTWRRLQILKNLGNVIIQTNSRYTVVTVCQYDTYNPSEGAIDQQSDQQVISDGSATDQQVITKKKEKKGKKVEEGEKEGEPAVASAPPPKLLELIDAWNDLPKNIAKSRAERDPPSKAALKGWASAMREPKKRDALLDIPKVLAQIRTATYCHGQGWFTVPWLFGNNKDGEFKIVKLINGGYEDGGNQNTVGTSARIRERDWSNIGQQRSSTGEGLPDG